MAAKFRNLIASSTVHALRTGQVNGIEDTQVRDLARQWKLEHKNSRIYFKLNMKLVPRFTKDVLSHVVQTFPEGWSVAADGTELRAYIDKDLFIKEVLTTTAHRPQGYTWSRNALFEEEKKHVLVEFSSPNIAKPFHIGHFRSTVIGNFVANINRAVGHQVTSLNYLGDWGTQFGFLLAGLEQFSVDPLSIQEDGLHQLLEVYIQANQLAEQDPVFLNKAREQFCRLEAGDPELTKTWKFFREISIQQLRQIYTRLNIAFDEYSGESLYSGEQSTQVLNLLRDKGLLQELEGRQVIPVSDGRAVTVLKSDGSSLYITRDIAAAIDRYRRYSFDRMIYVVDNAQAPHFSNLFKILEKLGCSWSSHCSHVRFGKILGMSTRKGNMIFLDSIIDEARGRMLETQAKAATTRVEGEEGQQAATVLGISALVLQDFKQRRTKDYKFSWDQALNPSGDTGVRLQYLHARLTSLLENSGVDLDLDCSTEYLVEPEAVELVYHLGVWDEVLSASYRELEPCYIVRYLFTLCNLTNRCLKRLIVKGTPGDAARARLLLFYCSRRTLADAFRIIGIHPLDRM